MKLNDNKLSLALLHERFVYFKRDILINGNSVRPEILKQSGHIGAVKGFYKLANDKQPVINVKNEFTLINTTSQSQLERFWPFEIDQEKDIEYKRMSMNSINTPEKVYSFYPDNMFKILRTIYDSNGSELNFRQRVEITEAIESRCTLRRRDLYESTYNESCTIVNLKVSVSWE